MPQFLKNERFGDGRDGNLVISGTTTQAPIDSICTGTAGTKTLSATNASFVPGQIILIHQTQILGAGQWELNVIGAYTAGTITTKYNLDYTYTSNAQVIVVPQYQNITVNATWMPKAWDGARGGFLVWMCNGYFSNAYGQMNTDGRGFIGGQGNNNSGNYGNSGEGTAWASIAGSAAANGNGGGGSKIAPAHFGAAGGSNRTSGLGSTNGIYTSVPGNIVGDDSGVNINLGGGGGGKGKDGDANNDGQNGAGCIIGYARKGLTTGNISCKGNNGLVDSGAGAGGFALFFTAGDCIAGTDIVSCKGGTRLDINGYGGDGGFHCNYAGVFSGSSVYTTLHSTKLSTLNEAFFGGMM